MNCERNIRDGFNEKAKQSVTTKRENITYYVLCYEERIIINDSSQSNFIHLMIKSGFSLSRKFSEDYCHLSYVFLLLQYL